MVYFAPLLRTTKLLYNRLKCCLLYTSSLPGLTLALGEKDEFEDVMKTAEKAIREFINGEPVSYTHLCPTTL